MSVAPVLDSESESLSDWGILSDNWSREGSLKSIPIVFVRWARFTIDNQVCPSMIGIVYDIIQHL